MQSPEASTATPPTRTQLHLALAGFADEVAGTLAHLLVYVGVLALFAILSLAALDRLPDLDEDGSAQNLALGQLDSLEKTAASNPRAAIPCTQTRPSQVILHNGPRLPESRARAEPDRPSCDPAASPDWLLGAAKLQLRGTL
ncbi:hypothetical protein JQ625_02970 [Bradyrhizobium diazoefficiens]|nr:hypothetical protein [Bradyrhizobium diazoefficiens]MBR0773784.1 hypothetical protein [Bradyrhizobium diazoefficiens]